MSSAGPWRPLFEPATPRLGAEPRLTGSVPAGGRWARPTARGRGRDSHAVDNPDSDSEMYLLRKYGPNVPEETLLKLTHGRICNRA